METLEKLLEQGGKMNYLYITKEDKLDHINYLINMANSRIETGLSDTISQEQLNNDIVTLPFLLEEKEKIENE